MVTIFKGTYGIALNVCQDINLCVAFTMVLVHSNLKMADKVLGYRKAKLLIHLNVILQLTYKQKLPDGILQVMLQHCQQLLMYLQKCVSEVYHLHIPCAREPIIYLECPLQHDESCLPHITLDHINISEDLVCPKSDYQIVLFETYALLFTHHLPIVSVHI